MDSLVLYSLADALVPQVAADWLYTLCQKTGQAWGPNGAEMLFWFRSPKVHIFEFVVLHIFILFCFRASWGYFSKMCKSERRGVSRGRSTKSGINNFIGIFFLFLWVLQVLFKSLRPQPFVQLGWLLMPCHLITLIWAFVFLRQKESQYALNVYLATLAADYHWGPTAASLVPDFGDHQYRIENYFFVLHHGLLLIMPFYFSARYELLPMNLKHLLHVTGVATLVNIGPYTLFSYVSGLNLNYMLYPPPKLWGIFPFTSKAYRFYIIAILIGFTVAFHVFISETGGGIKWILSRVRKSCGLHLTRSVKRR
ncbi:Transmembrane protein 164 [Trypanosoma melophagium]|uniref:Transmembrane protein 164 n=1 Tax=Trypanosoma melophagium TaxID=715481 RepID=UPI00351A68B2|nr:Transmembrane protein 164 [Trypanosoma melophagium]